MEPQSTGVLASLGIEGKLFIAQLVNFGIVLFVLWKLAYKPLLKAMDDRAKKIEQGLSDASAAAKARTLADEEKANIIAEARKAAKEIMDAAATAAAHERQESTANAKAEVEKIVMHGKEMIRAEKDKMMAEAKEEIGSVVVMAAERVLRTKIDSAADAKLVEAAIKEVQRS